MHTSLCFSLRVKHIIRKQDPRSQRCGDYYTDDAIVFEETIEWMNILLFDGLVKSMGEEHSPSERRHQSCMGNSYDESAIEVVRWFVDVAEGPCENEYKIREIDNQNQFPKHALVNFIIEPEDNK